ncbi:phage integrase N-terminal SAM-like domain-containing protein [Oceanisphaera avium]|uniref:phage integrase N-terminal SAM-like domain-containing protein n=1 Tax=Oceanisphaera avium TaxID=1903694 RepID=UPI0018DF5A86
MNALLSWLATERQVAAATQNLALNAMVFLYARVLDRSLGDISEGLSLKRTWAVAVECLAGFGVGKVNIAGMQH